MKNTTPKDKCRKCGKDDNDGDIVPNDGVGEYWCRECVESESKLIEKNDENK